MQGQRGHTLGSEGTHKNASGQDKSQGDSKIKDSISIFYLHDKLSTSLVAWKFRKDACFKYLDMIKRAVNSNDISI